MARRSQRLVTMGVWCPPSVRRVIWRRRSFLGFGNRVFAMIGAHMTIDVKEAEHVAMFSDAPLRDLLTECLAALACRQLGQLAAQGLDFRHAVQTHNAAQFPGGIFLQRLRAWDAEKS